MNNEHVNRTSPSDQKVKVQRDMESENACCDFQQIVILIIAQLLWFTAMFNNFSKFRSDKSVGEQLFV